MKLIHYIAYARELLMNIGDDELTEIIANLKYKIDLLEEHLYGECNEY